MTPIAEVLNTIKQLVDDQTVFLCLQFKKARIPGKARKKIKVQGKKIGVKVVKVCDDHIIVSPTKNPTRILSISLKTNVSRLVGTNLDISY